MLPQIGARASSRYAFTSGSNRHQVALLFEHQEFAVPVRSSEA